MTKTDVEAFLRDFETKGTIWPLLFRDDRKKNTQVLIDMDITAKDRTEIIQLLEAEDYVKGPTPDTLNIESDLWEFGKVYKEQEIYIKLTLGTYGDPPKCISFHPAERPLKYPLKNQ